MSTQRSRDAASGSKARPDGEGGPSQGDPGFDHGTRARITRSDSLGGEASVELPQVLLELLEEVADDGTPGPRLRAIGRHLPLCIWEVSENAVITSCFGSAMARLGLGDGDLDGVSVAAWGGEGEAKIRDAIAGEPSEFDAEGVFDDRPFAMKSIVVPHPNGGALAVSIDVTDQYLAKRALDVSQDQFEVMADTAAVGIFLADEDGANIYTNAELQRQFGRSLEETLGMAWLEAVHPDDRHVIDDHRSGRASGEPYDVEYRVVRPDGEERWLEVSARRVHDKEGTVIGYAGTTQDITDRRASEVALLAREWRFRTLSESAPIAMFLTDRSTRQVYANPMWEDLTGLPAELFTVDTYLEHIHPDDRERVVLAAADLSENGTPLDIESRMVRPDGSVVWVRGHAVPLHNEAGETIGLVGTLADITREHEQREQLRESEELNRAVLETAAEGIVTVTEDATMITFNAAAERIFGWDSDEAIGKSLGMLLPDPHRDVYLGYLRHFRETGETTLSGAPPRELPGLRRDGSIVPIELTVTMLETGGRTLFTGLVRDVSERKEMERQLEHQATHDPLTSLPNRALLAAQLENALARAYRTQTSVAVLFVSLDRVKVVTDSLGHRAGDELRVAAAQRLQGVVRPADTVTRFGEDEFVVLAEDLDDVREAVDIAQSVIEAMAVPFDLTIDEAYITSNVGISYALDGIGTAESLVGDADVAMFRAKEKGVGQFEIFDSDMRAWINERRKTEVALRHALEGDEFELHYQPIVSLPSAGVTGLEALVRWNRRTLGMTAPGEFIPVAEDSGLILPLGEWILGEACQQLADLQQHRHNGGLSMAVNLSGRQLAQRDLAAVVQRSLDAAGADPSGLSVEITETVLLDDVEQAGRILGELKDIGVSVSIDDFGTGYSSLTYLRRFPIDVVKIDRSFVSKLGTDSRDASIVKTVILLAEGLDLDVVAEGVETREQLDALSAMGCGFAQGFFFSKPQPVGELEGLLR